MAEPERLVVNETTELTIEQFLEIWRRGHPDESYVEQAVAVARRVLEAASYDLAQPLGNLMVETLAGDEEHHYALRVIYHADQMARAMAENRIVDVRWHALRFERAHTLAATTEAWGTAVFQKRRRDAANRKNIARHNAELHTKAEKDRAPWREEYRTLRAAGMSKGAARREIGSRISEAGGSSLDETTLRKWFPG